MVVTWYEIESPPAPPPSPELIVRVECVNKQNAVDIVYINYNVPQRSHYLHLRQLRGSVKIPIHF